LKLTVYQEGVCFNWDPATVLDMPDQMVDMLAETLTAMQEQYSQAIQETLNRRGK
jgi:hypothetical protein